MTFVKKYMLFSALVITCATAFVSAAEKEAASWRAAEIRKASTSRKQRQKNERSTDFRNGYSPENQRPLWQVPSTVHGTTTILGMARRIASEAYIGEVGEQAQGPEQAVGEQQEQVLELPQGPEVLRREEAILRARSGRKERCCFL